MKKTLIKNLKTLCLYFVICRFMCWLSFHKWDRTDNIKQPCKNCNLTRIHVNGFNKWTSSWCYLKNDI